MVRCVLIWFTELAWHPWRGMAARHLMENLWQYPGDVSENRRLQGHQYIIWMAPSVLLVFYLEEITKKNLRIDPKYVWSR
jgi:hypothetical protein